MDGLDDRLAVDSGRTDATKYTVQNRVAKIQDLFPIQNWRHMPSHQNPSDLIS